MPALCFKFNMYKRFAVLVISCIFPSYVLARPPHPPRTVDCSFNGVRERCVLQQDSDGSISLKWSGGLENGYDCGRYQAGKGEVYSAGKVYSASCRRVKGGTIYKTINGTTFVGD